MSTGQQFLFEPEKPLVSRLGRRFFKKIPAAPGVYKMHDAAGKIVYVGKAKDLRQRLQSYRVANPERLGRRHLRLLQTVTRIEFELHESEQAALKQEAKLIRELRPKFNRAGVWPGKPQFLVWRFQENTLELATQETPQAGWERLGPLGGYAPHLKNRLARLLWQMQQSGRAYSALPAGWLHGRQPPLIILPCPEPERWRQYLAAAFWGEAEICLTWLASGLNQQATPFEQTAYFQDLEDLKEFLSSQAKHGKRTGQPALL